MGVTLGSKGHKSHLKILPDTVCILSESVNSLNILSMYYILVLMLKTQDWKMNEMMKVYHKPRIMINQLLCI